MTVLLVIIVVLLVGSAIYMFIQLKKKNDEAEAMKREEQRQAEAVQAVEEQISQGETFGDLYGEEKLNLLLNMKHGQQFQIHHTELGLVKGSIKHRHVYRHEDSQWIEYVVDTDQGIRYLGIEEEDGEVSVSLSTKLKFHKLGNAGAQFKSFWDNDQDAKIESMSIEYDGVTYCYDDDCEGTFIPDQNANANQCWFGMYDFESSDGERFLSIEVWDQEEGEFEAAVGYALEMSAIVVGIVV